MLDEVIAQLSELRGGNAGQRRHTRPAVVARNRNPIDAHIGDSGETLDHRGHFRGRCIFALPAEGIADAIDEMEIALLVLAHEIASPEPDVARREHITQELVLGRLPVRVSLEASRVGGTVGDAADRLAYFAGPATDAAAAIIAQRDSSLDVVADQCHGRAMRQERRDAADGARPALVIEQGDVAFGRRIEFEDARKLKAFLEIGPDVATQPIAAGQPDTVRALE